MKGDFSRVALDASRFSRVVAQQGRIQLDADWNEQQAIIDYRLRAALSDLFGHGGLFGMAVAPRARAGFAIHVHQGAQFDGSAAGITAPAALAGFGRTAYTVDLWIRTADLPEGDAAAGTLVRGADFRIGIDARRNVVFARTVAAKDGGAATTVELVSRGPLRTDGYAFISCVFAGDAMEIWVDGMLDRRRSAGLGATPAGAATNTVAIGEGYCGAIEQIAFWRKRRFRDHILHSFLNYDGTGTVVDGFAGADDLAARWRFDDRGSSALPFSTRDVCYGPGRCYVDGRLCENDSHRMVSFDAATVARARATSNKLLAYVDVWERYVSAYEDATLRDVALGGLDTSGRTRTMAHVGLTLPADFDADAVYISDRDRGEIAVAVGSGILQDNLLYRFEVHEAGFAARDREGDDAIAAELHDSGDRTPDAGAVLRLDVDHPWGFGQYLQVVEPAGFTALIRVLGREEHDSGSGIALRVAAAPNELLGRPLKVRGIASMLWSRENGNLVFAVDRLAPADERFSTIVLRDEAARGGQLRIGDVVVLSDVARTEEAQAGFVTTIVDTSVDVPGAVTVTVHGRVPDMTAGVTLRKWDGIVPIDARGGSPPIAAGDVTVRFGETGYYRSGDYWLATLRPDAPAPLEWPRDQKGTAVFLPPLGIEHTYAPLAWVSVGADGFDVVEDARRIVPAAGDLLAATTANDSAPLEAVIPGVIEPTPVPPPPAPAAHPAPPAVPLGALLLGRSAPPGYVARGSVVEARVERPRWRSSRPALEGGAATTVTADGVIYALYDRGTLLKRDPSHPDNPWEVCATYGEPRTAYAVVAFSGRVYVLGGFEPERRPSRRVDVYDPHDDRWTQAEPMRVARANAIAAAAADGIVVLGGVRRTWFGYRYTSLRGERFDGESWDEVAPLPVRRHSGAAVALGGALYVFGGVVVRDAFARAGSPTARVDRWHRRTELWTPQAPLQVPRVRPHAAAVGDTDIVVGGGGAEDDGAERYVVASDTMRNLGGPVGNSFGIAAVNGVVYTVAGVAGGTDRSDVRACTVIDRLTVYQREEDTDGL